MDTVPVVPHDLLEFRLLVLRSILLGMQKVAPVAKLTVPLLKESPALLGLVSVIQLLVLSKLMCSMSELAPVAIRTTPIVHKLSAQLQLLLGLGSGGVSPVVVRVVTHAGRIVQLGSVAGL